MLQGYSAHLGYDMVITYLRSAVQVQVGNGYRLGHPYFGIYKTWWCGKPFKTHVQINRVCLLYMGAQHFPELEFSSLATSVEWWVLLTATACCFKTNIQNPCQKETEHQTHPRPPRRLAWHEGIHFGAQTCSNTFIHPKLPTLTNQKYIHQPTANQTPNHEVGPEPPLNQQNTTVSAHLQNQKFMKSNPEYQWESTWLTLDMDGWTLIPCVISPAQIKMSSGCMKNIQIITSKSKHYRHIWYHIFYKYGST